MATFDFNKEFQLKILTLLQRDFDFLSLTQELLSPKYFADDVLGWFFLQFRDHYLDYQTIMSPEAIQNELIKHTKNKRIAKVEVPVYVDTFTKIVNGNVVDKQYVKEEVLKFVKHQAIKAAAIELPVYLGRQDFEGIEKLMAAAFDVGHDQTELGIHYFVDWPQRLTACRESRRAFRLPVGISELDELLGGGLKAGQLGIWQGSTGKGKSLALVHTAKRPLLVKRKVLHYSLELSAMDVAERYDASFSKIDIGDLYERENELATQLESLGRMWKDSLLIKSFPSGKASIHTLKNHVKRCQEVGFDPDLILVDYLDLMAPSRSRQDKWDEQTDMAIDLSGWASELNIPVWSATQGGRASMHMEVTTEAEIAGSIGKAQVADVLLTLNQTKEELGDSVMRIFVAKNRNGPKGCEVYIRTAMNRMCFYDPIQSLTIEKKEHKQEAKKK